MHQHVYTSTHQAVVFDTHSPFDRSHDIDNMEVDNVLQIIFGIIGTLATFLGITVVWRCSRSIAEFLMSRDGALLTYSKGRCRCLERHRDQLLPSYHREQCRKVLRRHQDW